MTEYVVFRGGPDGVNEGDIAEKPVLRVQAASADEACRLAAGQVSLASGQRFWAQPAGTVDAEVQELDRRVEAL